MHLAFHPSSSVLVIAAADKSGHVGLWSVDECLSGRPSTSASKENRAASPARGEGADVKGVTTGKSLATHQAAACCSSLARLCVAAEGSCKWPLQVRGQVSMWGPCRACLTAFGNKDNSAADSGQTGGWRSLLQG